MNDKIARIEELLTKVSINAELGEIRWATSGTGRKLMSLVGSITSSGYRSIWANGNRLQYHQVLFYSVHGYIPQDGRVIDHIDRDKLNNRIDNLRDVTIHQNAHNNGAKGVSFIPSSGKWHAYLYRDGKNYHLGTHNTEGLAIAARNAALSSYASGEPIKNNNKQRISKQTTG